MSFGLVFSGDLVVVPFDLLLVFGFDPGGGLSFSGFLLYFIVTFLVEFKVDRFAGHTGFVGFGEVDVEGLIYGGFVGDGVVTVGLKVEVVVSTVIACVVRFDSIPRYLSGILVPIIILFCLDWKGWYANVVPSLEVKNTLGLYVWDGSSMVIFPL